MQGKYHRLLAALLGSRISCQLKTFGPRVTGSGLGFRVQCLGFRD